MKKMFIINTFLIFGLCFITHFVYDKFPNDLTALFFPVNESIWEHMKMLFTTFILFHTLELIYLYYKKIDTNNYLLGMFISALISIPIYLIMYLPIYYTIGENMIITFIILFTTIAIVEYIYYKIINKEHFKHGGIIAIAGIIIAYIIFGILTYNPPKYDLFFDTEEEKYGINHYNI